MGDRKENDVFLKIRPINKDELEQQATNKATQIALASTELRAIQEMAKTSGWVFFMNELKNERLDLLQRQLVTDSPTTLAKLVGSNLLLERFTNWVSIRTGELEATIADLNKVDEE